ADDEKVSIVLGVDQAIAAHRHRRVGGPQSKLLEDVVAFSAVVENGVEVAVLAVGVGRASAIGGEGVGAPLETARMIVDAGQRPIRVPLAAQRVIALELPAD